MAVDPEEALARARAARARAEGLADHVDEARVHTLMAHAAYQLRPVSPVVEAILVAQLVDGESVPRRWEPGSLPTSPS